MSYRQNPHGVKISLDLPLRFIGEGFSTAPVDLPSESSHQRIGSLRFVGGNLQHTAGPQLMHLGAGSTVGDCWVSSCKTRANHAFTLALKPCWWFLYMSGRSVADHLGRSRVDQRNGTLL